MYNSQYYTCEQIDQRLLQGYLDDYNSQNNTNLTKEQFLTLLFNTIGRNSTVDNLVTQIGYYECDTAGSTAAKAITVANYALFAGGSLKVKFINKNTANNATLNINSQGAKALYYQGERASATNSWDAEEVVEIYYDGTSYYANNVNGGSGSGVYDVSKEHPTLGPNDDGKFTLEYILNSSNVNELIPVNKRYPGMSIQFVSTYDNKYVQARCMANSFTTDVSQWQGVDDEPTSGSNNLVKSGGVKGGLDSINLEMDSYLFNRTYNVGESIKASTLFPLRMKKDTVYRFTLTNNSTVNSVYFYVLYKGDTNVTNKGSIGKGYGDKSFDRDVEAFALYNADSLSAARTVELTIDLKGQDIKSRLTLAEKDIDKAEESISNKEQLLLTENSNTNYGGVVRTFKANHASEIKLIPYYFEAGVPYSVRIGENSGKDGGTFYVRYEGDSANTNIGTISKTPKIISLEHNAVGFAFYSAGTPVNDYTVEVEVQKANFDNVAVKGDYTLEYSQNIYKSLGYIFSTTLNYSGVYTRVPLPAIGKANEKIVVDISTVNAKGLIQFYLLDREKNVFLSQEITIKNSDKNVGAKVEITPAQDFYFVGFYVSPNWVTNDGVLDIKIYKKDSNIERLSENKPFSLEKYKYNYLITPRDILLAGKANYLYKDIIDTDVFSGQLVHFHIDSCTGSTNLTTFVVKWFNGSGTLIRTDYNNWNDFVTVVPDSCSRMLVRLYPQYTNIEQTVIAEYKNVFVTIGLVRDEVTDILPPDSYYFTDNYLNNKIIRINNLYKDIASHGDIFPFITDIHYETNNARKSFRLLNYIIKNTKINKLFGGGDYTDGVANQFNHAQTLMWHLRKLGIKLHLAYGNHEYLNLTPDDQLQALYDNSEIYYHGDLRHHYYYFDDNIKRIRYIILAAYAESEATKTGDHTQDRAASRGYSEEQVTWLQSEALSGTPSGYDIIVFTHRVFEIDLNSDVIWNQDTAVINALDSYKSTHTAHILVLTGHAHRDRIVYTSGNIPIVVTTCDKYKEWPTQAQREDPESPYYGYSPDINVTREVDTITEQAFDICLVDTETHTLRAVRIGGKARDGVGNNIGDEVEERIVTY